MLFRPFRRAVAALAVVLAITACDDEFAPDPDGGFLASMEADGWPAGLIIGDTVTLRVAVVDEATGTGVLPADIDWSTTPPNAFQLIFADADSAVFRVLALGDIEIEASLNDPAFDTAAVSVTIPSRLAGVVVEASAEDTLRSIGEGLVVRARGIDANGDEIQVSGWTWTVRGTALAPSGSQSLDSLRVVSSANGSAWIIASHAQCAGACADSVQIGVRQAPASIQISVDSLLFESIDAEAEITVTVRDALGQPMGDATGVVWETTGAAVSVDEDGDSATIKSEANGLAIVRALLGALVDEIPVRVAQRAVEIVSRGGAGQTDTVGSAVTDSLQVEARDAEGSPVAGVSIGWAVAPGAGSITGGATTDANGRAAATWTLGTVAGAQSASAFIAGVDTVAFGATALAGPAASVIASADTIGLSSIGSSSTLGASVTDAFGNPRSATITWTSLTPGIASVAATGLVTALSNGTAHIEARTGVAADTVVVVVLQVPASLTLSVDSLRFAALGAATSVTVTVRDSGNTPIAAPSGIVWETTAGAIAGVSADVGDSTRATVLAAGNGVAFVRARIGAISDEASVTVQQVVTSVLVVGGVDQAALVGTLLPDSLRIEARDAMGAPVTGASVAWSVLLGGGSVSGSSVTGPTGRAAVAWTLGALPGAQQVRAIVAGADTAFINATGLVGGAISLTVTPPSATLTFLQDTAHLTATLRDGLGNVIPGVALWSSSNESVAIVGPTGVVTAVGPGSALVFATAGLLQDTSTITVSQLVASITLSTNAADTLSRGDTLRVTAIVRDSAGAVIPGAPITWTSTDTSVATVSAAGTITARARGVATIRASSGGTLAGVAITVASFALGFDGGDVVEVANSAALDLDSAFTIELWVRPRSTTGGALIGTWNGSKAGSTYALYLRGLVPRAFVRGGSGGNEVDSVSASTSLALDVWQHVAFVYENGTGTIYVNGVAAGSATGMTDDLQQLNVPLRIGADAMATPTFLTGDIDEIRIWQRARTPVEMLADMSTRLAPTAGLAAYWPLYLGVGDPVDIIGGLIGVRGDGLGAAASPAWILDGSPAP